MIDTLRYLVKVKQPFKNRKVPCPAKGTIGEIYNIDKGHACVKFKLPITDENGRVWKYYMSNTDFIKLRFKLHEIEAVKIINKKYGE